MTSVTPVGSYDSSCSGAVDPNYAFTYVDGSVTVGPASITVTASSGSMTYGGAVPTITANVAGLQNGETASVLGSGLTCSTTATSIEPGGDLPEQSARGRRTPTTRSPTSSRLGGDRPGGPVGDGVVGVLDLRRHSARPSRPRTPAS